MMMYLSTNQVLLKNFGDHVEKVTERLKEASLAEAKASRRPVQYLNSSQIDKETIARNILAQDGVRSGLVCVLSCLEPCWKFEIHRDPLRKKLELQLRPGKCLFLYHYQVHPVLGFLNARIQTWFAELPGEIEAGLDPKQIAKMLGESLRQHFLRSGVQDTVSALQTTSAAMTGAQKELSAALRTLSDSHGGVVAQVERANNRIEYSLETYFERREEAHMRESSRGTRILRFLWYEQSGLCPVCHIKITRVTGWRLHYCVSRIMGGSTSAENCLLLHPECHDRVHRLRLSVS
jgi:5-methylcytosine-specific restriction endonuclease McrA